MPTNGLPAGRFLQTLEIVAREGKQLPYSWNSLFSQVIGTEWVRNLKQYPGCAERLGVLASTEQWLEARNLCNRPVYEYITAPAKYAEDLMQAREYSLMLLDIFSCLCLDAMARMGNKPEDLPGKLALPKLT